ncbi:MAG: lysylphosphatidylglycerol synthase transmembrane domain-containing protein [Planctomycetota bacterium]
MSVARRSPVAPLLKATLGLALVGWLLWLAAGDETLARLREAPPSPAWLGASAAGVAAAITLSWLRWRLVAEAARVTISVAEAIRLGAIGFALNFVALGNVGGDVAKAALLAKGRPGLRGRAVSTVLVDRLMGLLGLLLLASAAVLASGLARSDTPAALRALSRLTLAVTGVGVAAYASVFFPDRLWARGAFAARRVPVLGALLRRAAEFVRLYRGGGRRLLGALALGLLADAVFVGSFAAVAEATPLPTPGWGEHALIVPLAMIAGALPISPSGLGTIEATVELLYRQLAADPATAAAGVGTIVALTHRLVMVVVGVAAAVWYSVSGTTGGSDAPGASDPRHAQPQADASLTHSRCSAGESAATIGSAAMAIRRGAGWRSGR